MRSLLAELFTQEAAFEADGVRQERALRELLADPEGATLFVARDAGGVVGMVCLLYVISTALGRVTALLEDMVVTEEARGQGVGGQLIDFAIEHAKQRGCKRITLHTDEDNAPAHRFYREHGFERCYMVPFWQKFE
uniref:N-acetyltransferase domain-containing protein n=1 Tax=Magnetococcus massalia (strain MO-1) TaxID=451514 RepID=A0A1S7LC64_MAGMO|nr:Putative protein with N-acetyltransferase activity [Candidatus Magnetococcus massalia]